MSRKNNISLGTGILVIILSILIIFIVGYYLNGKGIFEYPQNQISEPVPSLEEIYDDVAIDSVLQYNTALSEGASDVELCTLAGIAKAAYLQAQDNERYKKWLDIETQDCSNAGINF